MDTDLKKVKSLKSGSKRRVEPNWLLRGLIGVSLAIHLVIFLHITDIYRSNMLTYIELTLKDISKPSARNIPRPRKRHKPQVEPQKFKQLKVMKQFAPQFKPIKMEPAESDLPDSVAERISLPNIPEDMGMNISDWTPGSLANSNYDTSESYLEMIRQRIEQHKHYPRQARERQIEGMVTIRFIITPAGNVQAIGIARSSRHSLLNEAAIKAVQNASPFPKPPNHIYQGELALEVNIVFELTHKIEKPDKFKERFEGKYNKKAITTFRKIIEDPYSTIAEVGRLLGFSQEYACLIY